MKTAGMVPQRTHCSHCQQRVPLVRYDYVGPEPRAMAWCRKCADFAAVSVPVAPAQGTLKFEGGSR